MPKIDIEFYREEQYHNYMETLNRDEVESELYKCDGCGEEFEELTKASFHDLHNGKPMWYCKECIKEYQSANL